MRKVVIGIILLVIILFNNICFAESEIIIKTDKDRVKSEEEVSLEIQITNTKIASLTLDIYFDLEKLEYISGPENSNFSNNRIIYTWVDSKAKENKEIDIKGFRFKALKDGIANIVAIVEGYDLNGNKVELNNNYEIIIGEEEKQIIEETNNKDESTDNANLQIMRLNHEGISPEFNKNIKEYYFIADSSINSLDVTAIPENTEAKVNITGNTNMKVGLNTINIEVISKDGTKKSNYKIYVTKTNNIEMANANLETLAVRHGQIIPEFDNNITRYRIEVSKDTENIDILAIPQNVNSKVQISSRNLQIGENNIEIVVIAADGITRKKYNIIANRRNEEQEEKYYEEQNSNAHQVQAILNENNINETKNDELKKDSKFIIICCCMVAFILIVLFIIFIIKRQNIK